MKLFGQIANLLPVIMTAIAGVQATVSAPGAARGAIALEVVKATADALGAAIPSHHIPTVTTWIDKTYNVLKMANVLPAKPDPTTAALTPLETAPAEPKA